MGLKLKDIHQTVRSTLKNAGIESYDFETDILLEEFCGVTKEEITGMPEKEVTEKQYRETLDAATKRATHYPLQYIIKTWDFFGMHLKVGKGVLIPRPDTEVLVEHCLDYLSQFDRVGYRNIVDLCSGTGCIPLAIEEQMRKKLKMKIYAIEYDEQAYSYLVSNVKKLKSKVIYKQDDVLSESTIKDYKNIDLIVSNPPYLTKSDMMKRQEEVTYEPFMALYGGEDGLYFYRKIIHLWKSALKKDGMLALEVGKDQHNAVRDIFLENGYTDIKFRKDYAGIIRVVSAIKRS